MKKPKPPCKGCKDRSAECHASCEKFSEYEKARREYYEVALKDKGVFRDLADYYDGKRRRLRRKVQIDGYRSRS